VSRYIDEHRGRFGVEPICRVLGVSASAYYQRATGERAERVVAEEQWVAVIKATHAANYCAYGYCKMWLALKRDGHDAAGRDRVKQVMREHAIQGAKARGKPWRTTTPDPAATRPPDLVDRDFSATGPTSSSGAARIRCCSPGHRRDSAAAAWTVTALGADFKLSFARRSSKFSARSLRISSRSAVDTGYTASGKNGEDTKTDDKTAGDA